MNEIPSNSLAVIFDLGNVLITWNPRRVFRKFFDDDEDKAEQFLQEIHFYEWNVHQDAGRPFAEGIADLCRQYPHYAHLIQEYDTNWKESIEGPIQPTVEIVKALHQQGKSLYALSNWSVEKYLIVRPWYEFFNWFDDVVISAAVQMAKPDPRIFEYTVRRINRPAVQCLMIDDSAANIASAQKVGMQTIHYRSPDQLRSELILKGLLAS